MVDAKGTPVRIPFFEAVSSQPVPISRRFHMHSRLVSIAVLSAAALASLPATAQVPMTVWSSPALMNTAILNQSTYNFINNTERYKEELGRGADADATSSSGTRMASTVAPTAARHSMPSKLAAHYPASQRQHMERTFTQVLDGYSQIESRFGIPRNDVAGAVAAFLVGSYMAYNDVDFPDEHFKPLVAQMRRTISSNPEFQRASNAEKQEMYEQMAILGTSLALTRDALKQQPNAQITSNIRQAGKGYLEQLLKTDAERVQITSAGLVLR
jgi:hypothetical protein